MNVKPSFLRQTCMSDGPPRSYDWSIANGAYYGAYPLDPEYEAIRLLTINDGAWADPVAGELQVLPLYEAQYNALSYTRGKTSKNETISIGGKACFTVTANLYAALKRLRQHTVKTVWIDAICVNQADIAERSAQVKLMRAIYTSATCVWVCLGQCKGMSLDQADIELCHCEKQAGICGHPRPRSPYHTPVRPYLRYDLPAEERWERRAWTL